MSGGPGTGVDRRCLSTTAAAMRPIARMDELRGPAGPLRNGSDLLSLELAENLVQQRNDLIEQTTEAATTTAGRRIEQTGNSAQQVPEQVALTRLCRDVQMDHVEVDDKAK